MARIKANGRALELAVSKALAPKERVKVIAQMHMKLVAEAAAHNRSVLGIVPPSETWVNGRKGAALETMNPDSGTIYTKFEIINDVVDYVWQLLVEHSPVGAGDKRPGHPGMYRGSHRLFADGAEVEPGSDLLAKEYVFISTLPYARKIEGARRGNVVKRPPESDQAPDGVYEATATMARKRFGNIADIKFSFRAVNEGSIQDYAAISLGGRKAGKTASAEKRAAYNKHNAGRFPAIVITSR